MSVSSKALALGSAVCVLVACSPYVLAQPRRTPRRRGAPVPPGPDTPRTRAPGRPSPMRHFQDMIESQRSQVRDGIAGAIGRIEGDAAKNCVISVSTVTPGEGRLLLCMQAHEDKFSNQCELALFDASRNIQQTMQKIGGVAEACWTDIQMQCGGDSSIARCFHQRETRRTCSPRCQAAAVELRPAPQQQAAPNPSLAGTPIFSADGVKVGEVTAVRGGLDGGRKCPSGDRQPTGLGTTMVLITPDEMKFASGRIATAHARRANRGGAAGPDHGTTPIGGPLVLGTPAEHAPGSQCHETMMAAGANASRLERDARYPCAGRWRPVRRQGECSPSCLNDAVANGVADQAGRRR